MDIVTVGTLDPHQVSSKDVDVQLVPQGRLPRVLVGREGAPVVTCDSLFGNADVCAFDCHRAVRPNLLLKTICG